LFLDFLQGNFELECTPWGNPTYNLFGWQLPCYLLDEGYCDSFAELMSTTEWSDYGRASGNDKCQDCMVHGGYEPSAVAATFGSWRGFLSTARSTLGLRRKRKHSTAESASPQVVPPTDSRPASPRKRPLAQLPVLK
jgi:hypothetical protein